MSEKIPEEFKRKGFTYELINRKLHTLLYRQTDNDRGTVVGYEVFEIRKSKPGSAVIGGQTVNFKGGERFPPDEAFGYWAYHKPTLNTAKQKQWNLEFKCHILSIMKEYETEE